MHTLTRLETCAAAIAVVLSPAVTSATFAIVKAGADPGANDATRVALDPDLHRCDFSLVTTVTPTPRSRLGTGLALIHTAGSRAIAEVHLVDAPDPGTHFDVGLIQEPRSSSGTCGPGDPGTAFTGMDTDGAGSGTVTVQDTIRPGTTGVWVIIERPDANSQNPAEFYASEFVAPV
jgi:hypothetical protein